MTKLSRQALGALFLSLFFIPAAHAQTRGWGYNSSGQLGIGNTTTQPSPVTISAVPDAVGIGGGIEHSLFLKADGTLRAAGYNFNGQLGDSTTTQRRLSR